VYQIEFSQDFFSKFGSTEVEIKVECNRDRFNESFNL